MADYVLVVQLEVAPEHDGEFNRLYDGEHVPNLLSVAGVEGGQRYRLEGAGENMPTYLAIYHIAAPGVPDSEEWKQKATTPGWMAVRTHITERRRGVFRAI